MPIFLKLNFMLHEISASSNAFEVHSYNSYFSTCPFLFLIDYRSLYFQKADLKGAKQATSKGCDA